MCIYKTKNFSLISGMHISSRLLFYFWSNNQVFTYTRTHIHTWQFSFTKIYENIRYSYSANWKYSIRLCIPEIFGMTSYTENIRYDFIFGEPKIFGFEGASTILTVFLLHSSDTSSLISTTYYSMVSKSSLRIQSKSLEMSIPTDSVFLRASFSSLKFRISLH